MCHPPKANRPAINARVKSSTVTGDGEEDGTKCSGKREPSVKPTPIINATLPAGTHLLTVAQNPLSNNTSWSLGIAASGQPFDALPLSHSGGNLGEPALDLGGGVSLGRVDRDGAQAGGHGHAGQRQSAQQDLQPAEADQPHRIKYKKLTR